VLHSDSPLDIAIELILRKQQRIIPVVTKKNLEGVISRSDIVNILMREPSRFPKYLTEKRERNVDSLMKERLAKGIYKMLKVLGILADSLSVHVYVVGGFVRDLLLNIPNCEVEIVVDGKIEEFVKSLTIDYKAIIENQSEFEITMRLPNDNSVPLTTARLEYYPTIVQLPIVELSSLKMELARKDFTVDAMAIQLNNDDFGRLMDFFNSLDDLNSRKLNVLHHMSFVEDPSRILKAILYEQTFNFNMGKATERFVRNTLSLGVFDRIQDTKFLEQLFQILKNKNVVECITRMHKSFGILKALHPCFQIKYQEKWMMKAKEILELYHLLGMKGKPILWKVYLVVLCHCLSRIEFEEFTTKLGFTPEKQQEAFTIVKQWRTAQNDWKRGKKDMSIVASITLEAIICLMTFTNPSQRKDLIPFLTSKEEM